jgi:hypothetical protein
MILGLWRPSSIQRAPERRFGRRYLTSHGASPILVLLMGALALTRGVPASWGAQGYRVSDVEAAFIYNFAKFVEWPAEAFGRSDSPIAIGIVGEDPFGPVMEQITQGKQVDGHPFVIRRMHASDDMRNRQILFISSSEGGKTKQLLERLRGTPVLTIGESRGFAKQGGVIDFVVEQGKVRFEINVGAARRARLNISSRLLSLAKIVTDNQEAQE